MRAFIAIDISERLQNDLGQVISHLKNAEADVKWVEPHNIHITMKFLGDIDDAQANNIKIVLDETARSYKPFEILPKKIGAFPSFEFPNVIWVGLSESSPELEKIACDLEEKSSAIGFLKESRPFVAHLTLGRARSNRNRAELKEKIIQTSDSEIAEFPPETVDSITLYESKLTSAGSIYTPIHRARFS